MAYVCINYQLILIASHELNSRLVRSDRVILTNADHDNHIYTCILLIFNKNGYMQILICSDQ